MTIPGGLPFIRYHFEIHSGRVTCFYDKLGPTKQNDREYDFEICPGFKVPEWAKGAVFYQIFVDRFCNGDTSNDVLDNEYAYIGTSSGKGLESKAEHHGCGTFLWRRSPGCQG